MAGLPLPCGTVFPLRRPSGLVLPAASAYPLDPTRPVPRAATPTVVTPDDPVLVTVPDVELLYAGTWATSTGEFTWTPEHLTAAIAALDDPAIKSPVLKIGHTSEWGDGEPALGLIRNLRTNDNRTILSGDLVGVPAWLAAVMPTAWPGRSIEGYFDWSTANMGNHLFVLTALALLGVVAGAVETLSELPVLFGPTAPAGTTVDDVPIEDLAA